MDAALPIVASKKKKVAVSDDEAIQAWLRLHDRWTTHKRLVESYERELKREENQ